jgi:phage-related protein
MVSSTEEILWGQNVEYIKSMQEVLKEVDLSQEAGLINRIIKESVDADARFKQSLSDAVVEQTSDTLTEAQEALTERFKETLGTLAEEASSELVQAELAAMGQAISDAVQTIAQATGIADKLKELADEFAGVEIGRDTPTSVLNDLMSRYPKSGDVKG